MVKTKRTHIYFFIRLHTMNLNWFVILIVINVASSMKSIQKIPPKYNTQPVNPDLITFTLASDENSFPDVVYPTSILDIAQPFYFNTANNFEVLEPFSEDVKSSYKMLSATTKHSCKNSEGKVKNQTDIDEVITNPIKDALINVLVKDNKTDNSHKDDFINSIFVDDIIEIKNNADSILFNTAENYDYYNASFPQEERNESTSNISLHVNINIEVFKTLFNKNKEKKVIKIANEVRSQDNIEKNTDVKQVTDTSTDSSKEVNSSSEEHYTELQDIKHSDFINVLSVLLLDLLISTNNVTSEMWNSTLIGNESCKGIALDLLDNLTISDSSIYRNVLESNATGPDINITDSSFENMLILTEPLGQIYGETIPDNKEDYFLDFLISLDSLCENNNTVETFANSEYLTNCDY